MTRNNCTYCGEYDPNILLGHENDPICPNCRLSKGDMQTVSWFLWLKANDPQHWQKIVDNHRLGMDPVASTIRRIRTET